MAIYVLLDEARHCCKIGFSFDTNSAQKRVKSLQTASPYKLELICINDVLNRNDEYSIHKMLSDYSTGGGREWFDFKSQNVIEAVEYIKNATETKFPDVNETQIENQMVIQDKVNQCECDCTHRDEDDDSFEFCQECSDKQDWNCVCLFCIFKNCVLGELVDDVDEFRKRVKAETECTIISEDSKKVQAYLNKNIKNKDYYWKAVSQSELANLFLERIGCNSEASKARIADLLFRLCGWFWNESNDDEGQPKIFISGDEVAIVFCTEFNGGMEIAEFRYVDCFWDVDELGFQLFCTVFNQAREFRDVPLELAYADMTGN